MTSRMVFLPPVQKTPPSYRCLLFARSSALISSSPLATTSTLLASAPGTTPRSNNPSARYTAAFRSVRIFRPPRYTAAFRSVRIVRHSGQVRSGQVRIARPPENRMQNNMMLWSGIGVKGMRKSYPLTLLPPTCMSVCPVGSLVCSPRES